jgi:hypothetical protein
MYWIMFLIWNVSYLKYLTGEFALSSRLTRIRNTAQWIIFERLSTFLYGASVQQNSQTWHRRSIGHDLFSLHEIQPRIVQVSPYVSYGRKKYEDSGGFHELSGAWQQDFEKISRQDQDQDLTLQDQDQDQDLSSQDETKIKTFTADALMLKSNNMQQYRT